MKRRVLKKLRARAVYRLRRFCDGKRGAVGAHDTMVFGAAIVDGARPQGIRRFEAAQARCHGKARDPVYLEWINREWESEKRGAWKALGRD